MPREEYDYDHSRDSEEYERYYGITSNEIDEPSWFDVNPYERTPQQQSESFEDLDHFLYALNLGSAEWSPFETPNQGFVQLFKNPFNDDSNETIVDAYDFVEDALNDNRDYFNSCLSKLTPNDLSLNLKETLNIGDALIASSYVDADFFTDESKNKWNDWHQLSEAKQNRLNFESELFKDTLIVNNLYDENNDGHGCSVFQNYDNFKVKINGENIIWPFETAKEALTWLQKSENYSSLFENVKPLDRPFSVLEKEEWNKVPPKYRTEAQHEVSFENLNDILKGMNIGEAVWTKAGNGVLKGEQGSITLLNPEARIMVHNMEEAFTDPKFLAAVNNAMNQNFNKDDWKTILAAKGTNEVFTSRFITTEGLDDNAIENWGRICQNADTEHSPNILIRQKQESMENEVKTIRPLINYIGLETSSSVWFDDVSHSIGFELEVAKKDNSDSIYKSGNSVEELFANLEPDFQNAFLNGKQCCNYFQNFKTYDEARQTADALGYYETAGAISFYMSIMNIPKGKPIAVPFIVDHDLNVACGKAENGKLYVQNIDGFTFKLEDSPSNRQLAVLLYHEYKDQANNYLDNTVNACGRLGYRVDRNDVADWVVEHPGIYHSEAKTGSGYVGVARKFIRDQGLSSTHVEKINDVRRTNEREA